MPSRPLLPTFSNTKMMKWLNQMLSTTKEPQRSPGKMSKMPNLTYNTKQPWVRKEKFYIIFFSWIQEHTQLFYRAKENYEQQNWSLASLEFEQALSAYLNELEDCRLLCEKPFDHGWFPDFVSSIASECNYPNDYVLERARGACYSW